ncbi:DUF1294 domain-containing protein [Streptococcus sp. CF4-2]|uniref:DUF1294 domain-containing protein n=1 Tax=unclassified Streptococcus TaxID=2608887 RepID=UPI0020C98CBA|nr:MULTISPECIES: DUF1294 domain-containing protein [unclassified Streptococcus]MCP9075610.1 DUF1294 domain-containing protein [Streptococcus sp. CF4-3]MCP9088423.1 DUF1294 domain-containing protein [Streptococcus sp. CF4-2]
MKINQGITFAILIWNLLVFMIYGIDKSKARKGAWRIPEKYLLSFAFLCGGFGAWLAGVTFHHKTRKWYFKTVWFLGIVTTLVTLYLIWR